MEDSVLAAKQLELIKDIVEKGARVTTIPELWMQLFFRSREKQFPAPDTNTLREFLQSHGDEFVVVDDTVALKRSTVGQKILKTMANTKKEVPNVSEGVVDLSLLLKRNIAKKENDIVQIFINLVNEKPKMTVPMLAANMSSLSQEQHTIIGHGQKALVKYLKKYPEIFCIIGDSISVSSAVKQQLSSNQWHSTITDDSLHQVLCTVTKIGPLFGFLTINETSESTVYFTSYVFEGGNSQDLTRQLRAGDVVLVDAEKGDPNCTAEWRAKKVVKVKKQTDGLGLRRERGSSCDQTPAPSLSECSEFDWEASDNLSVASSTNVSVGDSGRSRDEIVEFLKSRISSRNGKISVQNLTGHLSALPSHLRKCIGCKLEDLKKFLQSNCDHFMLEGEEVTVRETNVVQTPAIPVVAASSRPLKPYYAETATIFSIDASGNGVLTLPNDVHAHFDSSVIASDKAELKKGMIVTCDAVQYSDRWEIARIWHSPTNTLNSYDFPISGHVSTVVRIFPDYGFISYGDQTEDNIYFQKDVVEGLTDSDLTVSLPVGSKVICDAAKTSFYSSKYRAIRVIPLIEDNNCLASATPERNHEFNLSNHTDELYVSDDESGKADSVPGKLYSCTGRVMNVYGTHGFIQRGMAGKDPENVYFNLQSFMVEERRLVRSLTDVVQIGDIVTYDAELAGDHVSCRWRAMAVWKQISKKSNADLEPIDEILCDQRGSIVKVYPSKGIITFGPHLFLNRVFFSIDNFYVGAQRVHNLMEVLKPGDHVQFDAMIDEGEVRMKWKATRVWQDVKHSAYNLHNEVMKHVQAQHGPLHNKKGIIGLLYPAMGLINYGPPGCQIYFNKELFYDDGKVIENLQWVLKLHDEVCFDAVFNLAMLRFEALVVWRGRRPWHNDNGLLASPEKAVRRPERIPYDVTNKLMQSPALNELDDISLNDDDIFTLDVKREDERRACSMLPLVGCESRSNLDVAESRLRNNSHNSSTCDDNSLIEGSHILSEKSDALSEKSCDALLENDSSERIAITVNGVNGEHDEISSDVETSPEESTFEGKTVCDTLSATSGFNKPTRSDSLKHVNLLDVSSNDPNSRSLEDVAAREGGVTQTSMLIKKCVGGELKQKQAAKVLIPWDDVTPKEDWIPLTNDGSAVNGTNDYSCMVNFPGAGGRNNVYAHGDHTKLGLLDWQGVRKNAEAQPGNQKSVMNIQSVWDTDDVLPSNLNPIDPKENISIETSAIVNEIPLPADISSLWSPSQILDNKLPSSVAEKFEKAWSVCFENMRRVCDASKAVLSYANENGNVDVEKVSLLLNDLSSYDLKPLELANVMPSSASVDGSSKSAATVSTQTFSTGEILSQHIYSGE